jgi:hypothetical protein
VVLHLLLILYFLPPLPLTYDVVPLVMSTFVTTLPVILEWFSSILVIDPNSSVVLYLLDLFPSISMVFQLAPLPFEPSPRTYFIFLILARCFYACWVSTYKI